MTILRNNTAGTYHPFGSREWLGHCSYWICQAIGWVGLFCIGMLRTGILGKNHVLDQVHLLLVCLLFSHIYRWFILKGHWKNRNLPELIFMVIASALVLGLASTAYAYYLVPGNWAFQVETLQQPPAMILFSFSFIFAVWSALYFGYHFHIQLKDTQLRELRLQMSMKEASLAVLQTQINPHFFFNGLNTLRALIDYNPEKAREVVTQMSLIFRASLSRGEKSLISLREELELVDAYLLIEKARFEDRLEIDRKIAPLAEEALVPPFLLQTLIENAVKYGISPFSKPGRIYLEANLEEGRLVLLVRNPGQIEPQVHSTQLGLKISRERLHLQFGEAATLEVINIPGNQVQARALIPQTI